VEMDRPTEPIPPASGGWGQEPPGGWGARPPAGQPPGGRPPWWRQGWVLGVVGFLLGAFVASATQEEQPVRTVTVTSIVTSLVPAPTTTTEPPTTRAEPPTTESTRAPTTTRRPRPATSTTRRPRPTTTRPPSNCHQSYPDFCIPPPPPDLDCADIGVEDFTVQGSDPHRFDADNDGVGCES
jgi:hypothetical protein